MSISVIIIVKSNCIRTKIITPAKKKQKKKQRKIKKKKNVLRLQNVTDNNCKSFNAVTNFLDKQGVVEFVI